MRFSPDPIVPGNWVVFDYDPAPGPGATHVVLDAEGRLLTWRHVCGATEDTSPEGPVPEATWRALIVRAGLDPETLRSVEPQGIPPVYCTEQRAWELGEGDSGLRVVAAGLRGLPVLFGIERGGKPLGGLLPPSPPAPLFSLVLVGLMALAAVLAWRNVRSRRAYVGGAIAVGMFAFVTHALLAFAVPAPDDLAGFATTLFECLSMSLHTGVRVTLFYLALEPFARRRWPRALIAWSRLLEGRVSDPSVGREILVGLGSGMAMLVLLSLFWLLLDRTGAQAWDGEQVLSASSGTLQALGQALHGLGDAVMFVGLAVFLLVLLRSLIPQPWLGNGAWLVLHGVLLVLGKGNVLPQSVTAAAFLSALLVLLTRLGFLAVLAYASTLMITVSIVLTLRPGDWQFSSSVMVLGAMAALAAWAYRVSVAGRSAFD